MPPSGRTNAKSQGLGLGFDYTRGSVAEVRRLAAWRGTVWLQRFHVIAGLCTLSICC